MLPSLRELPGVGGYYLIDAGGGVLTSVGLFETSAQAHESTRIAARWVREQKLEDALPNTPKITAGPVIARETRRGGHDGDAGSAGDKRGFFQGGFHESETA